MKKSTTYLVALLASLLLSSCQSLYFATPQPKGNPHLSQVPQELLGNYLVMGETGSESQIYYNVHPNGFVLYEEEEFSVSIDSLEKEEFYIKDSLLYIISEFVPDESNGFPFTREGDTLKGTFCRWEEKLIGTEMVLTQDKETYFLNLQNDSKEAWECFQLESLRNGDLVVWGVDTKKEENLMKTILHAEKTNPDRDDWQANPNRRQFRKFIKKGGFGEFTHFLHKLNEDDLPDLMLNKLSSRK